MSSALHCRFLRPDESGKASELARRVLQDCVAEFQSHEGREEFQRFSAPEALRQRDASDYVTFVAERDCEIVGMLQFRKDQHIAMLFVERAYQRKGVARSLLRSAMEFARKNGQSIRTVTVASSPNAIEA